MMFSRTLEEAAIIAAALATHSTVIQPATSNLQPATFNVPKINRSSLFFARNDYRGNNGRVSAPPLQKQFILPSPGLGELAAQSRWRPVVRASGVGGVSRFYPLPNLPHVGEEELFAADPEWWVASDQPEAWATPHEEAHA